MNDVQCIGYVLGSVQSTIRPDIDNSNSSTYVKKSDNGQWSDVHLATLTKGHFIRIIATIYWYLILAGIKALLFLCSFICYQMPDAVGGSTSTSVHKGVIFF